MAHWSIQRFFVAIALGLSAIATGCESSTTTNAKPELVSDPDPFVFNCISKELPEQFSFITSDTTLQQVVDRVGNYSRVRGSGVQYFEFDLGNGSAVLVGPEWPFEPVSKVRNATFYKDARKITLAP